MKKYLINGLLIYGVIFASTLQARLSDEGYQLIIAAREKYKKRVELIRKRTEEDTDYTKETVRNFNIRKAQDAETFEEMVIKANEMCCCARIGALSEAYRKKPVDYEECTHCWDKLEDLRYPPHSHNKKN